MALQGWGTNSKASPTWMSIKDRDMPITREPYKAHVHGKETLL